MQREMQRKGRSPVLYEIVRLKHLDDVLHCGPDVTADGQLLKGHDHHLGGVGGGRDGVRGWGMRGDMG